MLTTRLLLLPVMVAFPLALGAQAAAGRDSSGSVTQAVSGIMSLGAGVFSFLGGGARAESRSAEGWCFGPCAWRSNARTVMPHYEDAPFWPRTSDTPIEPLPERKESQPLSSAQTDAGLPSLEHASPNAAFNREAADEGTDPAAAANERLRAALAQPSPSERARANASPNAAFNRMPSGGPVTGSQGGGGASAGRPASVLPWHDAADAPHYEWLGPVQGSSAPTTFASEQGFAPAASFEWVLPPAPALASQQDARIIVNPEPSTIFLMLAGLATLAYTRMRRRPG